jgi:hypothetical protein
MASIRAAAEQGHCVIDEPSEDRAAHVRRRFKAARLDAMGRSFWEHWRTEDCAFLVGMYSTLLILFLEPALWSDSWPAGIVDVRVPDTLALSLLLILPFNGWLLDRFLSGKTPGESSLPRWLLVVRRLSVCLPLVGLYAISLWHEALQRMPSMQRSRSIHLDLSSGRNLLPRGTRSRVLYRSGFFFVWLAGSLLPLLVWTVWLAQTTAFGSRRQPVIVGVCVLLHLLSGLSMAHYFRIELQSPLLQRWRRALLSVASVLWFLAIPGVVLGFASFLLADPPRKSLVWQAHASRTGASRDPRWRGLQSGLREQWKGKPWFSQWSRPTGLSHSEGVGYAEAQVTAFFRLKTLLLVLDSAALFGAVPAGVRSAVFPRALWIASTLAGVGLIIQLTGFSARLLRVSLAQSLNRHPYGRYLLLAQAAFLAGIYCVSLLKAGQVEAFGILLCLGSALCGILSVLFLFLPTAGGSNGPDMTLWAILFLSHSAWGGLIALDGEVGQPSLITLAFFTALTPLWSLGLFLTLGGWLLRPFSWRHVFDRRLPRRLRATLAFLVLTAAFPLGGLTIPFWIYARHRLWPRYAPLLSPYS